MILILNRTDWGFCSGLIRMWRHVGHRLDFFEWRGIRRGFKSLQKRSQRAHAQWTTDLAYLASTEDVQLLIHLCSNVAISSGPSILRRFSTLALSLPLNETSIRLRYSGISSRFGLSRPTRLRERGLYLFTPGTSREIASDAAAVIGLEWVC